MGCSGVPSAECRDHRILAGFRQHIATQEGRVIDTKQGGVENMKLLLGAAVAALLLASPAMAQTDAAPAASCGALEAMPPDQPDGATASREAVEAYTQRFNAWAEASNAVLACKRTQAEQARARADALATEFNTENSSVRDAITAWTAEVTEFNARPQRQRRDSRTARGQ
jgi:hypothetical protein